MLNQKSVGYLALLKKYLLIQKIIFLGLFFFALPVLAETKAPPQDFWDYMQDFGDDNGDVLDPMEYDQLLSMRNNDISPTDDQQDELDTSVDAQKLRHADLKIGTHSSTQASSLTKGAKL
jgi:hypothetical protein